MLLTNVKAGDAFLTHSCGGAWDSQITIFLDGNTTPIAYNDDNGPGCSGNNASVNWIAPQAGNYRILFNRFNCTTLNTCNVLYSRKVYPWSANSGYTGVPACNAFNTYPVGSGTYTYFSMTAGLNYTINTCGSSFDNHLTIYTLDGNWIPVAYNNDNGPICSATTASVNFTATTTTSNNIAILNRAKVNVGSSNGSQLFQYHDGSGQSAVLGFRQNTTVANTTSTVEIQGCQTKTLTASVTNGTATPTWALVGGGGSISGTTYSPGTYRGVATVRATVGSCFSDVSFSITDLNPPQALPNVAVGTPALLPDGNITSTGACCGVGYEAFLGRVFDRRATSNWSASSGSDVVNQYIQYDLGTIKPFNGFATQGRNRDYNQRVTSIDVQYSMDGTTWSWVPGGPFPANTDQNTVVGYLLGQYHARYVRLWPRGYHEYITMRGEIISIPEEASTVTLSADVVPGATTVRWYNAPTGGTLVGTGPIFTTPVLSQTTTYYAAAYNASTGCESPNRTEVDAIINTMYGAGPAGLGSTDGRSDMRLWLNAGAINQAQGTAIATWPDLSGNGFNATQPTVSQQPTLQTQAIMNGQSVSRFVTDDIINTTNLLGQFEAYTMFTASRLNGGQNARLLSSSQRNWLMGYWGNLQNVIYAEGWVSGGCGGPGGSAATTNPNIYTSTGNSRWTRLFQNGTLSHANACGVQSPGGISLGGTSLYGEYSNGDVAEVVVFSKDLSNTRRNILENYLSAKYNIPTSIDLYLGDNPGNGDCDFNVTGIGRDTEGWHQKGRSGGLRLEDGGYLANVGDYLMVGHNNSTTGWETGDLATCTSQPTRRLNRIWYFSKTDVSNNGGNVTLRFNAADLGLPSFEAGTYRLMYRAGTTGNFANVTTGTNNTSEITFALNASSLANGQYTLSFEGTTPHAVNFTSNNTYLVHSTTGISPTSGTVMGWVRPTTTTSWGFWQTHNAGGSNWLDWISMFAWDSGDFYFRMGDGSTCCNNDLTFNTATHIPINQWTHLAFTWGSGLMTVYVNGVQIAQRTATFQGAMDPQARIGQGHDRMMNGHQDEMGIYNIPLSAAQIQSVMFANVNNTNPLWGNMVAYFKMNEAGTLVYDLSKNANNASRVNGAVAPLYVAGPSITGTTTMCINSSHNYTASFSNNLSRRSFAWSVTGGTINSGQGTNQINVTWTSGGAQSVTLNITHHNECHTESFNLPVTVSTAATLGTATTMGPIDFCDASGNFGTAVTISGQNGTVTWEWGASNGNIHSWVAGNASGTCCFPKKVSPSDANADRMRYTVTNGTCPAVTSNWILIQNRYNEAPTALGTSSNNYCTGSVANITLTATFPTATNTFGHARFYSGSCGGTLVASTAGNGTTSLAATIASPTVTTTYYVRYEPNSAAGGCAPTACVAVTVNVTPATVGGTVSPATQTICADQGVVTTQHTLSGHVGTVIQWEYKTPSSGWNPWAGTGTTAPANCCFFSVGTWQVRALVQNSPCGQVYSSIADIVVVADPVAPAITPSVASGTTVCTGASLSATIGAGSGGTGTVADVVEYTLNGGTNWLTYTSGVVLTVTNTGNGAVQIRSTRTATGTNCDNPGYNTVTWNVVADPTISITTPSQTICTGAGITLNTSETGGTGTCTYQWQSRPVGNPTWTNMGTASSQATGSITVPMEYRVTRSCNGLDCNTATSGIVTLSLSTTNTWTGAAGTAGIGYWDIPGNWSCGIVPTPAHHVSIPPTAPNQPVIRDKATHGISYCKTINIAVGATLTNSAGGELRVVE